MSWDLKMMLVEKSKYQKGKRKGSEVLASSSVEKS